MRGLRGAFAGILALAALQRLLSSSQASSRVGGLFTTIASITSHALSPDVPAIPDLRSTSSSSGSSSGATSGGSGSATTPSTQTPNGSGGGTGTARLGPLPGLAPGVPTPAPQPGAAPVVPLPQIAPAPSSGRYVPPGTTPVWI